VALVRWLVGAHLRYLAGVWRLGRPFVQPL